MKKGIINFYSECDFELDKIPLYEFWLNKVAISEGKSIQEISYIFCHDEYLHKINQEYLGHDTLTDIISFDYCEGTFLQGDIFISVPRVQENAKKFKVSFEEELRRVLIHGILHFCGYTDKSEKESLEMREKEEEKMKLFHVEQ